MSKGYYERDVNGGLKSPFIHPSTYFLFLEKCQYVIVWTKLPSVH